MSTTTPSLTTLPEPIESTTTIVPIEGEFSWSDNAMTLGFSSFLMIGTIIWICIWCKGRKAREANKRRSSRPRSSSKIPSPTKPTDRKDDLPACSKTPSLASIQSTGSNYYDQLMGSGNIPKVKSISQYGALLAQQEPPPP